MRRLSSVAPGGGAEVLAAHRPASLYELQPIAKELQITEEPKGLVAKAQVVIANVGRGAGAPDARHLECYEIARA